MNSNEIISHLHSVEAIKFGNFTLKSGMQSPIYIDLRVIVSYPKLLQAIADAMWEKVQKLPFDLLCGVPYTALPIATAMSLKHDIPMVMRRKEAKEYGTKKIIEGVFKKGQRCLVVEDLITSGSSIMETIAPLEHEGLLITDAVVLLDREQGGGQTLLAAGYHLHSVFSISILLHTLKAADKINAETAQAVMSFIQQHQTKK